MNSRARPRAQYIPAVKTRGAERILARSAAVANRSRDVQKLEQDFNGLPEEAEPSWRAIRSAVRSGLGALHKRPIT